MSDRASGRYLSLDAMRGLAAIAVALTHLDTEAHRSPWLMAHGYLAVDFFFALSGFVLARAYDARFRAGATARWFMELRLIRLWPLFAIGILLGAAHSAQMALRGVEGSLGYGQIGVATMLHLFTLPDPFTAALYPTNPVFWSIFTELLANLAFASVLARLGSRGLAMIAAAAGIALILMVQAPHFANAGAEWRGLPLGLTRTAFSFVLGMMIARWQGARPRSVGPLALIPVIVLCAVLAVPRLDDSRMLDLGVILFLFPLLLTLGARMEPPRGLARTAAFLGDVSYALYAIHGPIAHGCLFIGKKLGLSAEAVALPFLAVAISAAALLVRFWDEPVRRWLSKRLAIRRSAMPQTL